MKTPGDEQAQVPASEGIRPGALSALLQELVRGPAEQQGGAWERALRPGVVIDHFELVREIGRGGFGVVWEARDRELGREVAFKAVGPGGRPDLREERLLREAESAARLSHPNIVTLFDAGRSEQGPYLVLELLRGETLARRLDQGSMTVREGLRIAVEVAKGLAHAHEQGVVHRDLTPGNVFLCRDGQVKVLDLGMAHAFGRPKVDGGTRNYMAPEQAAGAPEDERTDVFALGAVLYRMLSGRLPFPGAHAGAPFVLEVEDVPALGELVDTMLSRDPVKRPRNAGEVLAALSAFQSELGHAPMSGTAVCVRRKSRARLAVYAGGFVAVLAAVAALVVSGVAGSVLHPRSTPSVAVLPFTDLSPGHDQDFLADGVAEAILNALAHVPDFKVIGRTSSFSFKGKSEDLRDIGHKLDAGNILEGSLQRQGQRIRVTAKLVRVVDGSYLWSDTFDREESGIFEVQDEIATAVVEALKGKLLTRGGHSSPAPARTTSPEAYYQYLLGRRLYRTFTNEGGREAVAAYEKALKLDPTYAPAWAAQAVPLNNLALGTDVRRAEAVALRDRAMALVERSLELSPDLCDGLSSRGALRQNEWNWAGARADLERAVRLCPGDADAWRRYGLLLRNIGRIDPAIQAMRQAVSLDPLDGRDLDGLGNVVYAAGRLPEARSAIERAMDLSPDSQDPVVDMGKLLLLMGRPAEALDLFQSPRAQPVTVEVAMALHSLGRDREAAAIVENLEKLAEPWVGQELGYYYAWVGDRDRAFAGFERAVDDRFPGVALGFMASPLLRGLHDDPRWKPLLRRMNLPVE